jgi:hypothetical protein
VFFPQSNSGLFQPDFKPVKLHLFHKMLRIKGGFPKGCKFTGVIAKPHRHRNFQLFAQTDKTILQQIVKGYLGVVSDNRSRLYRFSLVYDLS